MYQSIKQPKPWNNIIIRNQIFQIFVLSIIIYFFWYLFQNTLYNLRLRGISTGFSFLSNAAGFEITQTLIPFDSKSTNLQVLWVGLVNTLLVSIISIICATIIGFFIAISRLSPNWLLSKLATLYIEVFRNIPLLLQILFWYFSVLRSLPSVRESAKNGMLGDSLFINSRGINIAKPIFDHQFQWVLVSFLIAVIICFIYNYLLQKKNKTGKKSGSKLWRHFLILTIIPLITFFSVSSSIHISYPELKGFNFSGGLTIIPEFIALWFALSMYSAAFIAEYIRAGIIAIPKGQTEASQSLGLNNRQRLRFIVIPQAMRIIIPPLASQYLNIVKNSSLALAIAYPDLVSVFTGTVLTNTGHAIECVGITMLAYLSISLLISFFMNVYNKKVALVER